MPSVSALVLTRNRRDLLLECLAALERQTVPVDRIVVVDNASSDGTEATVAGLGLGDRLVYRRLERNVGSAGGYAAGVETARELGVDWIWIMDDDAEPPDDSLERLLAAPAASDPGTAALASAVVVPGGEVDLLHRGFTGRFLRALPEEEYRPGNHAELGFSSFTGLLVSGRAARAEEPPRADFFIWADDVEYTIRLRRHGPIVLVPEAAIVHKTRMGGRGNTLRGRVVNRLAGVEYPSADWDTYWKNLHMFRNFAWIKREHFGAGSRELALVAGAYVVKSLLYDSKPLRRVPWILWASARGRRGEPLGMSPERWERVVREGLRPGTRMKVVFVSHYALPHVGGIESALHAVATGLTRRGHEVVHVTSAALRPAERGGGEPERPYRVVRVPAANFPEERLGAPYPLFAPSLPRVLGRELEGADVVHPHGFLYMGTVAALRAASRRGLSSVLTEHVGHVHYANPVLDRAQGGAIATLGRWSARHADALVVYNDKVREELARLAPGKPIHWIGNGVDPERFRPPRNGERERLRAELGWDERPRALFVGRRVAKKGLSVALATAAAGGGSFELVVAGTDRVDPPSGGQASGVPGGVELVGHVDPDRMPALYRAADAMLLPSHGEGFPVAVQEAMASGLPVVLAHDPAYGEHLRGAGEGAAELVPADPEALAGAVSRLVADPARRAAAGAAAADHARRAFGFEHVLDAHESLYRELGRD